MINFYLILTVILTWGLSHNLNLSIVYIARSLFFPFVTFKPLGFLILENLVLFAISFGISHIFIKAINLKRQETARNAFSISVLIAVLLSILPTMIMDYTFLKQCFSKDIFYALYFIKNASFMSLLLLLVIQISHLKFTRLSPTRA